MTLDIDPVAAADWHVVTHVSELAPGSSEHTRLLGRRLVVRHEADGTWSAGSVGAAGDAASESPATERPVAALKLRHGFVWVALAPPGRDVVDIPEFTQEGRRFVYRGRIGVPTAGQRVVENFIDLSHFSFVHNGTLGGYEASEVPPYRVEFREEGRELWATGCSFYQPKASAAAGQSQQVYYDYRVHSPFVTVLYKDSLVRPGRKDVIGLFIQPTGEESCIVHSFALVHDDTNSDTHILHFYHEIFGQDRMVMLHQSPRRIPVHPQREVPMASDSSSIAFRRWLANTGMSYGVDRDPA